MDVQVVLLLIVLATSAAAAWLMPWAAIAFVINGSVVYYALLDLVNVGPSAQLTGAVLAVPAGVATLRLVLRPGAVSQLARNPTLYLFVVFALIWYARWLIDPAPPIGFGARALPYMLVFAIMPFVAGLSIRKSEVRQALWWLLGFGVAGVAIVLGYWVSGAATLSTNFSGRWEPMPYLAGGVIAIDLGVACLSFFALFPTGGPLVALLGYLLTFLVVAMDIRLASRGPFLFLIISLVGCVVIAYRRAGPRSAAVRGVGLIIALILAYAVASPAAAVAPLPTPEPLPTPTLAASGSAIPTALPSEAPATNAPPRVAQAEGYVSTEDPATRQRFENLKAALDFIAQKPIFGWGGGLVGRDINGHPWDYAHNMLLDPIVETGVVGAVPFWTLFVLVAIWIIAAFRRKLAVAETLWPLLPLFAFAFLESLVSGHVANSRHVWLFMGMACGLLAGALVGDAAIVVRRAERGTSTRLT